MKRYHRTDGLTFGHQGQFGHKLLNDDTKRTTSLAVILHNSSHPTEVVVELEIGLWCVNLTP